MPIYKFESTYGNFENKNDTSLFVLKLYFGKNYEESNIEEDIDLRNHFKVNNLPCLNQRSDNVCKFYVDSGLNDPNILPNTAEVDFKDTNFNNVRYIKVNALPAIDQHLIPKHNVDNSIDESSLLRLDPDEKLHMDEQDSIILNSILASPKAIVEILTKSYVDSLHENSRIRRDLSLVFNDQDNDFDPNRLTNLGSIRVKRNTLTDNEMQKSKKKDDDSLEGGNVLRFYQTLENCIKISVGKDVFNLAK